MNRAQRRQMAKQNRGRAASGPRPQSPVSPAIAAMARNNVLEIIGQGRTPARAREVAVSALFLSDHLIRRFETDHEMPQPLACEAGCDYCCYNLVEVTPPEALLIGHALMQDLAPAARDQVQANLARSLELTAGKTKAAIAAIRRELPCPLLVERRCAAYRARPLVCRAMHGLDRERCETEWRTGSLAASPHYGHRHEIALSVSAGLREACRTLGLQDGVLNLARALDDFFRQADPVAQWLTGEEVFTP
jgi:hypothetical protein